MPGIGLVRIIMKPMLLVSVIGIFESQAGYQVSSSIYFRADF